MNDPPRGDTTRARLRDICGAALVLGVFAVAAWLTPGSHGLLLPDGTALGSVCPFHTFTGIDCPYCGLSRSLSELAHGNVAASFARHPAGPVLAAAMAAFVASVSICTLRRRQPVLGRRAFPAVVLWTTVAIGAAGLARCAL